MTFALKGRAPLEAFIFRLKQRCYHSGYFPQNKLGGLPGRRTFMAGRGADILCIGIDSASMRTRLLILERAGHTVTQARDLRQVQAACETISFSVAILGQSLNANEKMRVSDVVLKSCKSAKILELHTGIAPDLPHANEHLQANAIEPQDLIDAVNALL